MNLVKRNDHVHSARSNRSRCWLISLLFCLHRINLADWFPKSKEFANWCQRYQWIKTLDVFHSYKYLDKAFVFFTSSKLNICVFVYLWRVCICVEIKFVLLNLCKWAECFCGCSIHCKQTVYIVNVFIRIFGRGFNLRHTSGGSVHSLFYEGSSRESAFHQTRFLQKSTTRLRQ